MTKAEFVARVAAQVQLPKKQIDVLLTVFLTSIIEALRRGKHVELRGFGSFWLRDCLPREGRIPRLASRYPSLRSASRFLKRARTCESV